MGEGLQGGTHLSGRVPARRPPASLAASASAAGAGTCADRPASWPCTCAPAPLRIVDVSSIGELCKRWFPREFRNRPRKGNKHTALLDIKESVHELRYYKQHVFKKK